MKDLRGQAKYVQKSNNSLKESERGANDFSDFFSAPASRSKAARPPAPSYAPASPDLQSIFTEHYLDRYDVGALGQRRAGWTGDMCGAAMDRRGPPRQPAPGKAKPRKAPVSGTAIGQA